MLLKLKTHDPVDAMCTYFGDELVYPNSPPRPGDKSELSLPAKYFLVFPRELKRSPIRYGPKSQGLVPLRYNPSKLSTYAVRHILTELRPQIINLPR